MTRAENFTWIGPVTSASSAGAVARGFVSGLERLGACARVLDTGDGAVVSACDVDSAVRASGSTVVRQAPLSTLAATVSILPLAQDARQVSYVVMDCAEPVPAALEVLARCDEVWAPSTLQAEMLCALGVERSRVVVVAPGVDVTRASSALARAGTAGWCDTARVLVIGNPAVAARLESTRVDGPHFERALAQPGTQASSREIERADVVVCLSDVDAWGRLVPETLYLGKPLAHVESGTALEYAGADDCAWFDAATAADAARLSRGLRDAFSDRIALERRSARARARIEAHESLDAAARALLARSTRPRVMSEAPLARVLAELGLPTPSERLAGSRARVLIVPVAALHGPWRAVLHDQLVVAGSQTDTTICLWVDDRLGAHTGAISALAEEEIARHGSGADVDVLVVVAPLAHAPRERFVTSAA